MTQAYNLGKWAGRSFRDRPRAFLGALLLLVVAVVLAGISLFSTPQPERGATPVVVPQPKPSQEEIERVAAERRAEAEREQAEARRREREREEDLARMKKTILENSKRDIQACAAIVRQRTDAKFYKRFSSFDAYATGEYAENIQMFGTPQEHFQFEKCMAERGRPLSKAKAEKEEK